LRLKTPARALAGAILLMLTLTACSPAQVSSWFAARGRPVSTEFATAISNSIKAEMARNSAADHAARHNGSRGTCSETGIFYAESGGNWHAHNARSSASGGYQFLDSTWGRHRGYASATDAPPWVQREKFLQLWNNGAGRSHWAQSVC
jgi:hypothetical protein